MFIIMDRCAYTSFVPFLSGLNRKILSHAQDGLNIDVLKYSEDKPKKQGAHQQIRHDKMQREIGHINRNFCARFGVRIGHCF